MTVQILVNVDVTPKFGKPDPEPGSVPYQQLRCEAENFVRNAITNPQAAELSAYYFPACIVNTLVRTVA